MTALMECAARWANEKGAERERAQMGEKVGRFWKKPRTCSLVLLQARRVNGRGDDCEELDAAWLEGYGLLRARGGALNLPLDVIAETLS
jgi:hypothetical protein